jgi:hypothetical protein
MTAGLEFLFFRGALNKLVTGKGSQAFEAKIRQRESKAIFSVISQPQKTRHTEFSDALRSTWPPRRFKCTMDAIHKGADPGSNC